MGYFKEHITALSRYPDPEYRKLQRPSVTCSRILRGCSLGSGTSQLIQAYIAYLHPKRALLNSPCYSEYERELDKIGAHIVEYNLDYHANFKIDVDEVIRMIREESIDLYVLTNPNNPTGSILTWWTSSGS